MVINKKIDSISLDGGTLCLDFVNTVHHRKKKPREDYLFHIHDLLAWGVKMGLLDKRAQQHLAARALEHPKQAARFYSAALNFRELLYAIFLSVSQGKKPDASSMKAFNNLFPEYFSGLTITQQKEGFRKTWNFPPDSFLTITSPIFMDAFELLLSDKLERIKECPNCGWLFLDSTRNGKRRWCSMKNCGSNVKALDWYYRQKKTG